MHLLCVCVRHNNQKRAYPPRLLGSYVTRLVMPRTRRLSRSWGNCCHTCKIAVLNSSIFWHFGLRWLLFRPIKSHTCSIKFMSGDIAGHGIVWTASCCKKILYNSGPMWPSVIVHEHWPVSQRMIVEMGDYAWSEHIVTVFVACQITIKNVQVQLTVKGKTTSDSYTPAPKSSCAQNVVFLKWSVSLAPNPCTTVGRA